MANKVNSQFWPCFEYYEYVFVFHLKWSDTKTRFWVDCDFKNLDLEILPNGKTNEKKIIIIIIIILIWNLKLHFGLKKCWTKWALKQLKKYKSLGYIIKFSILTKKKEKSAYKYGIGLKGKIFFWVIVFCWIKLYWEIWCWRYGNDIRRNPKFLFIYLFIYLYIL